MNSNPETPVVIVPYNTEWINLFQNESAMIRLVIGDYISSIEHIGSTSIPGLAAKPIIDMLIGVKHLADSPSFIPLLVGLGYHYKPEYEKDLPERRYLYKVEHGRDTFHLHMVEPDTAFFTRHIAFRDYLRTHPATMSAYASLKYDLAQKFGADREGYTDAKTDFIKDVERKSMGSAE